MAISMTTIEGRVRIILGEYPVFKEDIKKISSSEKEKRRFINAYIAAVSPTVQQYLDSETNGRVKAKKFTTMMVNIMQARLKNIMDKEI